MHVYCVSVSVDMDVCIFDYLIRYSTQPLKTLFHMSMFTYLLWALYFVYCIALWMNTNIILFLLYTCIQYTDIRHQTFVPSVIIRFIRFPSSSVQNFAKFESIFARDSPSAIRVSLNRVELAGVEYLCMSVAFCTETIRSLFCHTPHHFTSIQLLLSRTWNSKHALDFVFWIVLCVQNSEWNINVHTFNI